MTDTDNDNVFFSTAESDDLEEGTYQLHISIPEEDIDQKVVLHEGEAINEVRALFWGDGVFANLPDNQKRAIAQHLTVALLDSKESSTVALYNGFKNLLGG